MFVADTVPNKKDITVTKFSKEDITKMNDNPMYKDYILNHSEDFPTFEDYYNFVMDPSIVQCLTSNQDRTNFILIKIIKH